MSSSNALFISKMYWDLIKCGEDLFGSQIERKKGEAPKRVFKSDLGKIAKVTARANNDRVVDVETDDGRKFVVYKLAPIIKAR